MEGVPVGLDYAAAEAAMRMMQVRPGRDLFDALRLMEHAALSEMLKRRRP